MAEQSVYIELASILVVDDNPLIVNVLRSLLLSENYQVHVSHDGQEAMNVLDTKNIDVIICDVMMPRMDGYQLHEFVRQRAEFSHIPFVFLTALGDEADVNRGREIGVDDYLTKPFEPQQLLSTVRGKVTRSRNLKRLSEARYESYRKRVVHTLSHEFRTPLVAINTGTELLLEQGERLEQGKIHNLLEAIRRGGQRLERLVNDFMLLQQIEAGIAKRLFESRATPKRLGEVIEQFVYNQDEELVKSGHTITCKDHSSGCKVRMYEPQILDVLFRLLSNAVKFSPQRKVIEIVLCPFGDEVGVEFRDEGIGIDSARVKEALDVFGQIDRDKLEQQGSGLGLPIANHYAVIHGGKLEFEIRPSGGSVVTLLLPVWREAS